MKQPNWLRCFQYFIISVLTFALVIQVECAEYRTIDVVGDGKVVVSDRRSDKGDSDSQVVRKENGFSHRKGSLDIRSRFWSDTGMNQPEENYPEEPEVAEASPAYATLSADNGEYVANMQERSDRHAYVTVDRKNKEHLVTISMPRMPDKTHLFKKFVIQPVIQYVVQYDKGGGRQRVARHRRGDDEDQTGGSKNFAEYEGYQDQDRMRRDHGAKIDRFFNDINTNFDKFWGNDGNSGENGGGGYQNSGGDSSGGYQNNGGGGDSSGGYQNNGGGGGSSGGYQNNGGGGGSSGGYQNNGGGGYQNSGEAFSQNGGSGGGGYEFSDGSSEGGYDATSQMHQPPEVNAFVSGGGYGDNNGQQQGVPGTPLGPSGSGGNIGGNYGLPGQGGSGTFSNSGNGGGMIVPNAMQMSSQPQAQIQQNYPVQMYGPPGMMSGGAGNGQMMMNMGMAGPSSSYGAPGMVQMNGMGMNMGGGGMSQVAPAPMMQAAVVPAPAQGMMVSMPMSMGPTSSSSASAMSAGQPMVTSQPVPQQMMMMMPMSAGGGAMQQQSMAQGGMQMPMSQVQPMIPAGMQASTGQGQSMMTGGIQVPTTQAQSTAMGGTGTANQGNVGMTVTNVAVSSGVPSVSVDSGVASGTAVATPAQQMGYSNANAAALLMQSMLAQSAALGAIGALTNHMKSNTELGANVQSILMGMGHSVNMGGSGSSSVALSGTSYGPPKEPATSYGPPKEPATSYGPPQESKAPATSYGPPKEMKEPAASYGPPTTSEPQGGYGGYESGGMSAEDDMKGSQGGRGKKPNGMGMMGGWGKPKGKGGGRGGKSLLSSLSLPKLPTLPSLGAHLSFMFSTGFGKGKKGGKMMKGGGDGGGGGSSKPCASEGKPIDQEQVSDHILNILGLTVHHPPRHSLLHSNQSASSNFFTNTTSPLELWEQQGNFSSLNHLTSLIQAGTPGDVVSHLPIPDGEDMNSLLSNTTTGQPPTTTEPSITTTTLFQTTATDLVTMTTEGDFSLSTTMLPMTTSVPEEKFTIFTKSGNTTTLMQTPTTIPPTTIPPTTTPQMTTFQVSSTTPRLPLNIRRAKAFYLPVQDILPSSLPTTAVFLTPPPPPPPPSPRFPGPTPPQIFPTMSTMYEIDPLKDYFNQNLQTKMGRLPDDITANSAKRPHLSIQSPNPNYPQEIQTEPNIEAYYVSPNFHGRPPVKIAQFDPMIYQALQAAFRPGHSTNIDNGVYFFETLNSKRKRSHRSRNQPIPLKDFRARSRRFHKVKGLTKN